MFPVAFDYRRATSIDEALALLHEHGGEARILAGGQSLIPAMRFRLARPAVLIDINPLADCGYVREVDGMLAVGALARDATLETMPLIKQVAIGPAKGRFKFKVALGPSADGKQMGMKVSGCGLGSVVDLVAHADVTDQGDTATTVDWQSTATMRGPVATVGGQVIDAQARRVVTTTFANVTARLTNAA